MAKISRIKKNLISDSEIMENIKNTINRTVPMMADELGVTTSAINEVLAGRNNISKNMKELLLWAYPINKNYIEFGYGDVLRDENISTIIKNQEKIKEKINEILKMFVDK